MKIAKRNTDLELRGMRDIPHLIESCPMFVCDKCRAVENVVCTIGYYPNFKSYRPVLCSECAEGKWHGLFRKLSLIETEYVISDDKILLRRDGTRPLGVPRLTATPRKPKAPLQRIYVIPANGLVKIGIAADVKKRWCSLSTANAHLEPVAYESPMLKLAIEAERQVHQELAEFRVRGEWFRCEPAVAIAAIQRLEASITS